MIQIWYNDTINEGGSPKNQSGFISQIAEEASEKLKIWTCNHEDSVLI